MKQIKQFILSLLIAFSVVGGVVAEEVVNVYNWNDYIAKEILDDFEKETGIKVVYDVFDSNEVLEAKLLAGRTGYDLVAPTSEFLARQIKAGAFIPLDHSKMPNWKNLNKNMLKQLEVHDPNNQYAFPYMWGTTGIGINRKKIEEVLGKEVPLNSWNLLFNPSYAEKIAKCGIAVLDAPTEIFPIALQYLGLDPMSQRKVDYRRAETLLMKIRSHITYFHSSRYISDLANGTICLAVGWSGDVLQAAERAKEVSKNRQIEYIIPKEGAGLWFDMLAIPQGAKNKDNAHKFINYLMKPKVIAKVTNYVSYANINDASKKYIDKSILNNPGIYPDSEIEKKFYIFREVSPALNRVITRGWNRVKSGR